MTNPSRPRWRARAAALAVGVVVPLLPLTPVFANDDGEVPGKSLGVGLTILYYVVIPIGIFLLIAGLAVLPSMLRRPRYRPGRPWNYDPLWFNGPDDPNQALASARPGATARGGASAEW